MCNRVGICWSILQKWTSGCDSQLRVLTDYQADLLHHKRKCTVERGAGSRQLSGCRLVCLQQSPASSGMPVRQFANEGWLQKVRTLDKVDMGSLCTDPIAAS